MAARFPSAIATDADLLRAYDRLAGELASNIDASTLSIPVVDGSAFSGAQNFSVTIEDEQILIASVSGNTLTAGQRGFAGTTAASHAAGALVRATATAAHHNALVDEVKAIETALGPNLSNVVAQLPFLISTEYDFEPQAPGGSLTAGVEATVTLSPVPLGVNGSDVGHYLYISGGNGTPEAVLITGGTAVSGAESGTIKFTPAHDHSGGWTIKSATAGVQEAINSLPTAGYGGGTVLVPQGVHEIFGVITVTRPYGVQIRGVGPIATVLRWKGSLAADVFFFDGTNTPGGRGLSHGVMDLQIEGESIVGSNNWAIHVDNQAAFLASRINISGLANGINITSTGGDWKNAYRDIIINLPSVGASEPRRTGVRITSGGGYFSHVHIGGDGTGDTDGFQIYHTGKSAAPSVVIEASDTLYCANGLVIAPGNGQEVNWVWVSNSFFDTSEVQGILLMPTGTGVIRGVHFVNTWTANNKEHGVFIGSGAVSGGGVIDGVVFIGHRSIGNAKHGYFFFGGDPSTPKNVSFTDCIAAGNGSSASNTYDGMHIGGHVRRFRIQGGMYSQGYGQPNTQRYGIYISAGSSDYYTILGVQATPNVTGGVNDNANGQHKAVANNL